MLEAAKNGVSLKVFGGGRYRQFTTQNTNRSVPAVGADAIYWAAAQRLFRICRAQVGTLPVIEG